MKKLIIICTGFFAYSTILSAQPPQQKRLFVLDSIPLYKPPEERDRMQPRDIADRRVLNNKDSLAILGYAKYDAVTFIFTKEYRNRPDSIKSIHGRKQMEMVDGIWYRHNEPYNGKFIDYYNSGKKQSEGSLADGRVDGEMITYYMNQRIMLKAHYKDGRRNGSFIAYYNNGMLKYKNEYVDGKMKGVNESYFPTGQIQSTSNLRWEKNENDSLITYYSTGRIKQIIISRNGFPLSNKMYTEINYLSSKYYESLQENDIQKAYKYCLQIISIDSMNADA